MKARAKTVLRVLQEGWRDYDSRGGVMIVPTDAGDLVIGAGSLWHSTPKDDVGPYTAVEAKYPGRDATNLYEPVGNVVRFIEDHAD